MKPISMFPTKAITEDQKLLPCSADRIGVLLLYEQQEAETTKASGCMGIDPGVDNLLALSMDTPAEPVLINGRPLKSINRYCNRKKAKLVSDAMKIQGVYQTNWIRRLTELYCNPPLEADPDDLL